MAKSTKQSIRESFEKAQEKKRIREQLNSTNFHTSSLPSQTTGKNRIQTIKDKARETVRDVRNGHADWHEPWWENDTASLGKALKEYQKKKEGGGNAKGK